MSDFKINFEELKKNIGKQKEDHNTKEVALGRIPAGAIKKSGNRKAFLNELVTSMHLGVKTNASETVRVVSETVEAKRGLPSAAAKNVAGKYIPPRQNTSIQLNEQQVAPVNRPSGGDWGIPQGVSGNYGGGIDGEREGLYEQQLAKQMAMYDQMKMSGNPVAQQILQQPQYVQQPQQQQYVVEQQGVGDGRNIEKLVEGAFKNVLTEIYTKQKIQEALSDFLKSDDFVKVVGQAINEIAKRNKAKQGK